MSEPCPDCVMYEREIKMLQQRESDLKHDRKELRAEIDRLTADLAEARKDRDAAIRERDARPAISREDAEKYQRVRCGQVRPYGDPYRAWSRVNEALRAHATGVDAPRVDSVCEECADGAYPYYGGAPGRDYAGPSEKDSTYTDRDGRMHTIPAGAFIFAQRDPAPREQWPANFTEDPDCPGLGTWSCPKCSTGRTEAAEASERRDYIHATTPPGPRHARVAGVDAPRVDGICLACSGLGSFYVPPRPYAAQERVECDACNGTGRTEGGK